MQTVCLAVSCLWASFPWLSPCVAHSAAMAFSTAVASSCPLLELSHDMLGIVAHELCDPLRPLLVVNLGSTAKGLRVPMLAELAELRQQRQEAETFLSTLWTLRAMQPTGATNLAELGAANGLYYNWLPHSPMGPTPAHWKTLGTLISCKSLPLLVNLFIDHVDLSEGVASLTAGFRRGGLPSLIHLALDYANLGDQGACTLAPALTKCALPSLQCLDLCGNQIGDAGLAALTPGLRRLPTLQCINLYKNQIGDQGVQGLVSLLAEPNTGALPSFQTLRVVEFGSNQISDEGCAALASALRNLRSQRQAQALQELTFKTMMRASEQAQARYDSLEAALGPRYDSYERSDEEGGEGEYTSEEEEDQE